MFSVTVHVIYPIPWIQIVVRGDGRPDVRYAYCPAEVLCVVEQFEFVEMGMAEKLRRYCAFVPISRTDVESK